MNNKFTFRFKFYLLKTYHLVYGKGLGLGYDLVIYRLKSAFPFLLIWDFESLYRFWY